MFSAFLSLCAALLLKLRYRIRIHGVETIRRRAQKGILFLPNHPAMIDPAIVGSFLIRKFHPWVLVNEHQIRLTVLKHLVKPLKLLGIPDPVVKGGAALDEMRKGFSAAADALNRGENVLMYPAGHIYRSRYEDLKGNSGVNMLMGACPEARVVMIRTVGLWGSSFSRSSGGDPEFEATLLANGKNLLKNLFFFSPRRKVDITFCEAADFPRNGSKEEQNRFLERFYNQDAPGNTYVPYTWWESGGVRTLAEPPVADAEADTSRVPQEIREKVFAKLREISSQNEIGDQDLLGSDLGMDSLMLVELCSWIQQEFGQNVPTPELLRRAGDVMLGAMGEKIQIGLLNPVPAAWFPAQNQRGYAIPEGTVRITDSFLAWAARQPDYPLLADQRSGILTNRTIILAILALQKSFARLPGERIGVVMPACAPFFVVFMALLFAGKTPVLLNWTVGPRNLNSCVRRSGVQAVLTSKLVLEGLEAKGVDLSPLKEKIVFLEEIRKKLSLWRKLLAFFRSRFCWRVLRTAEVSPTLAILFTSGSESEPKAVPLSHRNCIADVTDVIEPMLLSRDECVLGMLPPFHSFGLLISGVLPALINARTVFHTNPTEGAVLAKLIAAYRASIIIGTPTFANGILSHATQEELKSIHLIITGAEKCPRKLLDLCRERCPDAYVLEGYGITECSPIVALNTPGATRSGTIGHILKSLSWMICDEAGNPLPAGKTGMLFVSGPSVFDGYFSYDGPSPFVERDGKKWYRTGDLVEADEEGFITFKGRLKRFIKVAGEMVSLPAIEDVLLNRYRGKSDGVPLAVEADGEDSDPEVVLFAAFDVDRNEVNLAIREAGFSPIHAVRRVVKLEAIPLLGSGKTDYRKLKSMICHPEAANETGTGKAFLLDKEG